MATRDAERVDERLGLATSSTRRADRGDGSPHRVAALGLILTAAFMVVLDFSIVNVALASIEAELGVGPTSAQWVVTAYAITFGGLLVLGGRVGDLFGRRRMLVAGLVLFSLASLAGGLAHSIGELVAARAVQGVGAAIVAPASLSLVTTSVPEGHARNRALGLYGAIASIGFVAGLVLGGVLVQLLDWRAVLWVNVPVGLGAAVLTPVLVGATSRPVARPRLDLGGAVLVTAGLAAIVYGVSRGASGGWSSPGVLGALLVAAALLAAFAAVESRHPSPLVRLELLRLRPLLTANLVTVALGAWSAAELLVVPLYLQLVLKDSPLAAGLAIAPQGLVGFVGASVGARLVRKVGLRAVLVSTAVSAGLGLSLLGLGLGARSYPLLLAGFALIGYGTATGAFGATVGATRGVPDHEQGVASGLVNMSRQMGAALGVAVAAAIIGSGAASGGSIRADRTSLLVMAGVGLAAALAALRGFGTSGAPGQVEEKAPAPGRKGCVPEPGVTVGGAARVRSREALQPARCP